MSTPTRSLPLAALLALGVVTSAQAAFQLVENFTTLNEGAIGGQNGWVVTAGDTTTSTVVADPDAPTNKVLRHAGINDAYKLLPSAIADASGGTLFYRVRIGGATNDVSFGLSDVSPPSLTDFGTFEVQGNVTSTDGRFGSRDGDTNRTPLFNLTVGAWYNVWYVINTTTDTYRLYVQRDGDPTYSTQTEILSSDGTWNFRNAAAANPLVAFVIMSNSSSTNLFLDDIYVDTVPAPNLANPLTVTNPDSDGDGLEDAWEIFYFGNITSQAGGNDPDGDGYTNEQEETAGSNPLLAASTPLDVDGDGLPDNWEVTYFGSRTVQNGAGDFDGDGATNAQEYAAGSDPTSASSWPDTDGDGLRDAWELAYFGNLTTANGSGDNDGDGFSNAAEQAAGSSPIDAQWTPNSAKLRHRWSFSGDLLDSVGTAHATISDPDNDAAVGGTVTQNSTSVTLSGGASGTSAAVLLGNNLIGGRTEPVTLQFWATHHAVQNWGRIFDFGSSTGEYLFMSWTQGTNAATDQVEWIDGGVVSRQPNTNAPYTLGTQYHIVLTLTPAAYTNGSLARGTRVTWWTAPAASGATLSPRGTFDTTLTLKDFADQNNWLGRSMWAGDNVANATYDEVRIWNGALTPDAIQTYQLAGPNAFTFTDSDGDGLSDPWEITYFGNLSSGFGDDPDGDGKSNYEEYIGGSDPTNPASVPGDVDGDGLPDSWELSNFGNLAQTASGDPDGDGATNLQEYLAGSQPNSATSYPDTDFDFINDAWEIRYFGNLSQGRNTDFDGDGYTNGFEFDNNYDPTDPLSSPDSDVDGLPDGWEVINFKLPGEDSVNDLSTILARYSGLDDPDADGFDNSLEFAFGTNPASAASVPGDINNNGVSDGPLLKLGGDVLGTTSFDNGLNWLDGEAPVAGKTYIVSVNGLRTPPTAGDYTFAGDRLVLTVGGSTNIGTLIWKNDGAVTFPVLQMNGGTINHASTNGFLIQLNGLVEVTAPSTLWANNGPMQINAPITGSASLTLTGNNTVTFAGAYTSTGNLVVNAHSTNAASNRLTLAPTGSIRFRLGADSAVNTIAGAGAITLNGALVIDGSDVTPVLGNTWTLITNTGVKTYGSTFTVTGFAPDTGAVGARKWTSLGSAPYYEFNEATGVLTVVTNPDSDGDGLLDSWEITYFGNLARDGSLDFDGDGATDLAEFLAGSNPTLATSWPDSDGDGVNDAWEIATFGNLTTATATDRDGDTLLDAWELQYFASIATQNATDDSDGDTHSNATEQAARSNPADPLSVPGDINGDSIPDGNLLIAADALGTNSFTTGLNWTDSLPPSAGKNYLVDRSSLRTPADTNPYTFLGDRLVVYTGGNLLVKGTGVLTMPQLVLDGGQLHNGTDANAVVTVEGGILVRRASGIFAQNQGFVLNAALSGSGNLTLTGPNMVTFAGANTWKGNLALANTAGFTLAPSGVMAFAPGANGVTNAITGTNPAVLNGAFAIDTTAASNVSGAAWVLVATSGAKTYGETFTVVGFTSDGAAAGSRKWTSGAYTYDEATHTLSVSGVALTGIQTWRQANFGTTANEGTAANSADADNDGRANLLEYALGTDPNVATGGAPATVARVGNVLTLTFNHIGDASLTYTVEAGSDLAGWTTVATYTGLTTAGTTTYTDTVTLTGGVRRFLRLKVATP